MAAGVYISIPFCRQKCSYCNFASEARSFSSLPGYLDALRDEILSSAELYERGGMSRHDAAPIDSIYLGGGTPGLLNGRQLGQIHGALSSRFALATNTEFTIEAAPENATRERAEQWAAAGVNRVSMGVQSMVAYEIRAVGRQHTPRDVEGACANLRAAGIDNISIDLIAGLPYQGKYGWHFTVGAVLSLGVPHLSVYMLEVDEDSRLGREMLLGGRRYGADSVPKDEIMVDFYREAMARLHDAGYEHYEISNFARKGIVSRHNEKYWTGVPYFGFGVDAHSYDGMYRWANTDSIDEYLSREASGSVIKGSPQMLTRQQRREEMMFLGLRRREGLRIDEVARAGMETRAAVFVQRGWLEQTETHIRLTDDGVIFSNEVFAGFLGEEQSAETSSLERIRTAQS